MTVSNDDPEVVVMVEQVVKELHQMMLGAPRRETKYWKTAASEVEDAADMCAMKDAATRLTDLAYKRVMRERAALGQAPWMCKDCD